MGKLLLFSISKSRATIFLSHGLTIFLTLRYDHLDTFVLC